MTRPLHTAERSGRVGSTLASRLRRRLLTGLTASLGMVAIVVVVGLVAYFSTDQAYSDVLSEVSFAQDSVTRLDDAAVSEVLHVRGYLITGDASSLTSRDLAHRGFQAELAELQAASARLTLQALAAIQKLDRVHADYDRLAEEMIALQQSGQGQSAVQLFDARSDPLVLEMLGARRELQADIRLIAADANREFSDRTSQIIAAVAVLFLAASIAGGWLVLRQLSTGLNNLDYFERALAQSASSHPLRLPDTRGDGQSLHSDYNALVGRLEESEAGRLEFMSSMVHELRSQLASINGYAALLAADGPAAPPDAAGRDYAQTIVRQSLRLSRIVEDMMTAATIDEGRLDVILAPVRLGPLASIVAEDARHQYPGRAIQVDDELGLLPVLGDTLRLREVLWRLIDNALKFSNADTPVVVSVRRAEQPGRAEVSVADRGIGIAEGDMRLMFRRFGRVRNDQTRGLWGGGLSLFIVKHIVDRHGGSVELRSQPGQGTSAVMTLPLAPAPAEAATARAAREVVA